MCLGRPGIAACRSTRTRRREKATTSGLAIALSSAGKLLSALDHRASIGRSSGKPTELGKEEDQFPFNKSFKKKGKWADRKMRSRYNDKKEAHRRIDEDWMQQADGLALYLDTYTNNSSLVLAFELVQSAKVLLFAADAQTGNWLSWDQVKWEKAAKGFNTNTLLENTVFYKVGHHGSHNATLVAALEAMTHEELVAMIPVDRTDSNLTKKKNPWKMPAANLYKRLKEKTRYRVLRMDMGYADGCDPAVKKNATGWGKPLETPRRSPDKLYIEYTVKG